jgi:hypothetical protein
MARKWFAKPVRQTMVMWTRRNRISAPAAKK